MSKKSRKKALEEAKKLVEKMTAQEGQNFSLTPLDVKEKDGKIKVRYSVASKKRSKRTISCYA